MPTAEDRLNADAAIPVTDPDSKYVRLLVTEQYTEAQAAVDRLSDRGFPVHHTAIVGEDLRVFERITGRLDWIKVLIDGAITGLGTGLLIGVIFSLFAINDPLVSAGMVIIVALIAGAIIGALTRWVGHLATGGNRDFTSIQTLDAARYVVLCHADHAEKARELLSEP